MRFPSFVAVREAPDPVAPLTAVEDRAVARDAALAEAIALGRAEGDARALAEWTPRLAALAAALEAAGAALHRRREELATELGSHVAEIVLLLARKVLDRELTTGAAAVRATAEHIVRRLTGGGTISVRVAPDVAEALAAWRGAGGALGDVVVRADATLGRGDFIVETDAGFLDGRIATQLDEAARILAEPTS